MTNEELIAEKKAAYDAAQAAQAAAKKVLEDLKGSSKTVVKAFEQAKAAYDGLKPSLALAKAKVDRAVADEKIAHAEYKAVAPKEVSTNKGPSNKELLVAVQGILSGKAEGLTNQDIWDALTTKPEGATARDNFNSYLSRWGSAGSLVNLGVGKWGYNVPVSAPPSFLAPTGGTEQPQGEAPPSFLTPATTALTEDFPGYIPLTEAGFTTKESLAGKSVEALQQIKGIGAATAKKIAEALEA